MPALFSLGHASAYVNRIIFGMYLFEGLVKNPQHTKYITKMNKGRDFFHGGAENFPCVQTEGPIFYGLSCGARYFIQPGLAGTHIEVGQDQGFAIAHGTGLNKEGTGIPSHDH